MAKFSLRRFDTQARVGAVFAVLSLIAVLGQIALVICLDNQQSMDWSEFSMTVSPMRRYAVMAATGTAIAFSAAALGFGFNSAGHRRNDIPKVSWLAFFLGALGLTLAVIVYAVFHMRGELMKPVAMTVEQGIALFA